MSNKATTRWKQERYTRALKHDPSTHAHVVHEGIVLCTVVFLACHYCGKKLKAGDATVDHVIPRSKGGPNSASNFVLSCAPCNTSKGSGEAPGAPHPASGGTGVLSTKKRMSYDEEFKELLPPEGTQRLVKTPRHPR